MVEIELEQPLTWCGETYDRLELNFDKLKGKDDLKLRAEVRKASGTIVLAPEGSAAYLAGAAAKAAGVDRDVIEALSAADFEGVIDETNDYYSAEVSSDGILQLRTALKSSREDQPDTDSLHFDFAAVRGQDVIAAEQTAARNGNRNPERKNNVNFLAAVAAKAAGISYNRMLELDACDCAAAISAARDFFITADLRRTMKKLEKMKATQQKQSESSEETS